MTICLLWRHLAPSRNRFEICSSVAKTSTDCRIVVYFGKFICLN